MKEIKLVEKDRILHRLVSAKERIHHLPQLLPSKNTAKMEEVPML